VQDGAGITDQLLFDKVCLYELDYPTHVCSNLTEFEEASNAVQRVVNDFGRNQGRYSLILLSS
jgi:hypothetical protein